MTKVKLFQILIGRYGAYQHQPRVEITEEDKLPGHLFTLLTFRCT